MPKYLITATSFIDNRLVQAGEEIDSDATPAEHWTPLDKPAKKAREAADEEEEARYQAALEKAHQKSLDNNAATLTPAPPAEVAALPSE